MRRAFGGLVLISTAALLAGCAPAKEPAKPLPNGLLLALAVLEKGPDGKPVPQPAQLGILTNDGQAWSYRAISDPDSNVFHKAMAYEPRPGEAGVLTAGGTRAILKLWRKGQPPAVIWEKSFGGKFSRMREIEVADLYGDGSAALAVVTHDQGVVATVRPLADGGYQVTELDQQPDTFVHEVEVGDLDADGTLEVYATPSPPNKLDGTPQPGSVTRYVPATGEGRTVVAELGDRHAKEILVEDVDGDGTDELYVSIEAVSGGRVAITRFDAGTDPSGGAVIATLDDKLCRFLTAGDVDGDGKLELVAAAHKSGLWLLRPGADPRAEWKKISIDANSSGFEHAAILADLDENGIDELYVANDDDGEVNRYLWVDGEPLKETLYKYPAGLSGFTWNITTAPVAVLP
ncbi:MAG TPA: VCBS repeat-containing protein [Thermoanaerobaculales bacterium]|nr:VCBS repeat-containing protein [Thermoanaerobaculales bacterium]HPA80662.1 VCBS repeat-containing protein [Thermoanaerobaculales bacterium]HQL30308.1 VCBS repeat-containing protein [Thermoanaerobaculales bacterium]HQN95259.1 VCBS repeat-containing protein [Thermoanaerobaculales bacterium]HQP42499.1 VCBS repeat-containing protein [Thermoanaerobaculales bacterium]